MVIKESNCPILLLPKLDQQISVKSSQPKWLTAVGLGRAQAMTLIFTQQIIVRHKTTTAALLHALKTRMHFSRMRTERSSSHPGSPPRADTPPGARTPPDQTPLGPGTPLWTEFLTHTYENITLPQLRLRAVITQWSGCSQRIRSSLLLSYTDSFVCKTGRVFSSTQVTRTSTRWSKLAVFCELRDATTFYLRPKTL